MAVFENRVSLSESVLLEYNDLPTDEQCDDMWDEKVASSCIETACVNGKEAKLFSTANIQLLVDYVISEHAEFSQFLELRDIILPDVGIYMYWVSVSSYNDIDDWMKAMIRQLIWQGDIIPFSRSELTVLENKDYDKSLDTDTIFAVKCSLSPIQQDIIDQIVFQRLLDTSCYRISLDKDSAKYETDLMDGLNISEAITIARRISELIHDAMAFFSLAPITEAFRIYVRNNISNKVLEMDVSPTITTSYDHHYDVSAYISSEALQVERNYLIEQKKACVWEFRDINDCN